LGNIYPRSYKLKPLYDNTFIRTQLICWFQCRPYYVDIYITPLCVEYETFCFRNIHL